MSPHIGNISLPIIKPTEPVKRFYSDKLAAMIDEVIRHTHTHMQYNTYYYGVSPRINIKGGGVHQWYMMFGQQCSIRISLKGAWGSKAKGWRTTDTMTLTHSACTYTHTCIQEVQSIINTAYNRAETLLKENYDQLQTVSS